MSIGIHEFPITNKAINKARYYLACNETGVEQIRVGQELIDELAPDWQVPRILDK